MSKINTNIMLPIGTMLRGNYRIDRYLSNGMLSNTYVATNVQFHELVIVKELFMKGVTHRDGNQPTVSVSISGNRALFEEQREKFKKEARILRMLHSDHIVAVQDLFEENGTSYYVMDYIDGENLSERLKRTGQPLSEDAALGIFKQVLDALHIAHNVEGESGKSGILHLGIKPSNIMMDRHSKVKLIDFGASKQISNRGGATISKTISYTIGYSPREQVEQNLDKLGPWSDIYALGATLYTLLSNKRPPMPSDIDDDHSSDKHLALPMPAGISDKTRQLVLWMMKTDMMQRPSSVTEVKNFMNGNYRLNKSNFKKVVAAVWGLAVIGVGGYFYKYHANAKVHNPKILYNLGVKYVNGDGVPIDSMVAFDNFTKAAELGHAAAQDTLGKYFFWGKVVKRNYYYAVEWFRKAADQNNADAISNLAYCYENGLGAKQDLKAAVELYGKAASQNFIYAQYNLGNCYYYGTGVERNYKAAVEWYTKAAKQEYAIAQNKVGNCFYYGHGVQQNYTTAVEWYKKAAAKGNIDAQNTLGFCYRAGLGIEKDYVASVEWFRKAAERGSAYAQYYLAVSYENGQGVQSDTALAKEWYQKAASQGYKDAINALKKLK